MAGQKTMRSALLEKLLGRKKAAEVAGVTKDAQDLLDKAGVQRKSRKTKDFGDPEIRELRAKIADAERQISDLENLLDDPSPEAITHIRDARGSISVEGKIAELKQDIQDWDDQIAEINYGQSMRERKVDPKVKQTILDSLLRLTRKEDAPAEGTPLIDVLTAVGATEVADAVKRVFDLLTKAGQLEAVAKAVGSEEELSNLLAAAIAGGSKKQDDEVAAQANAAPAGTEVVTQPAAKEWYLSKEGQLSSVIKEFLGDYVTESTKDLASIAKAQLTLAETVDEVKALVPQLKELTDRIADVEAFLADSPQQASKSYATTIINEKLQKEIQDQVGETEMVAGIRVHKTVPNGNGSK